MKIIIKTVILTLILLCSSNIHAASTQENETSSMDSVKISLLTCSPHTEVYSLYGHTAIRYQNPGKGIDIVVNYGMFSFRKPFFILRFVFGLTDYEMGIVPFYAFYDEYSSRGCSVTQQTLDISNAAKERIIKALEKNYEPENRVYRYNYFYDNCTTRARDILIDQIEHDGAKVTYTRKAGGPSFRSMIHQYNGEYPWARMGNDLLLGVKADAKTSVSEQQFLPENLMNDFATARINGRPLVKETSIVVQPGVMNKGESFPLSPSTCGLILMLASIIITIAEIKKVKIFWGMDVLMMLLCGISGLIIFAMIFSQHPTVSLNLQIFLLNPLPLFYIYRVVSCTRKQTRTRWFHIQGILILLFLIGGLFQQYAEGMYFVALSLLCRCISHFIVYKLRKR